MLFKLASVQYASGMFLRLWFVALVSYAVIDALWIFVIAEGFYQRQIGHLMIDSPHWLPVAIYYPLFTAALLYFAVLPGIAKGSLSRTILMGAAFGLVAYTTYDLTHLTTVNDWPLLMIIVDVAWGSLLSATVAGIVYFAHRAIA